MTAASNAYGDGNSPTGFVRDVVERVYPSVLSARAAGTTDVDEIVDVHIKQTTDFLLERSGVLAERVEAGSCAVVGLSYKLSEGTVRLVSAHGPISAQAA